MSSFLKGHTMHVNHRRGETSSCNQRRRGGKWNKNPSKSWRPLKRRAWHVFRQHVRELLAGERGDDAPRMQRTEGYSEPGFRRPKG